MPGLYAAGSTVAPSRHAVRAGASGRRAALAIAMRLRAEAGAPPGRPFTVHIGRLHECEMPLARSEGSPAARVAPSGPRRGRSHLSPRSSRFPSRAIGVTSIVTTTGGTS